MAFKEGDIVVLSQGGKDYLKRVCPGMLEEWSSEEMPIRRFIYATHDDKLCVIRVYGELPSWMRADPAHFDLVEQFEYEYV